MVFSHPFSKYKLLILFIRAEVGTLVNGSHELFRKFPTLGISLAYMVLKPNVKNMKTIYRDIFGKYIGETIGPVPAITGTYC
jgi:hypothetical protein